MIDIHAPHETVHTWRDFLIHIATIVVGLIIAIGLEQTVELIHHHHQRQQLREDLQAEMRSNQSYLQIDYEYAHATRDWAAAQSQAIQKAITTHTTHTLVYQPPPAGFNRYIVPNDSVWQHASESGTASLLPRDEAQSYTLLFRFRSRFYDTYKQLFDATYNVVSSGLPFASGNTTTPDLQRMNPAQLEEYSAALSKEATALNTNLIFCGFMAGAQRALLDGSTDEADIVRAMTDNRNPYHGWKVTHSAPQAPGPTANPTATSSSIQGALIHDRHPRPHETVHTWRDFFIHIATIVVGLLIAIGLEQSVEYFHHRHLASEAREQLIRERTSNQGSNEYNIFTTQRHERDLHRDLAILHAVRNHTTLPAGPFIIRHPRYLYMEDEWRKVHQSGTINYLHENLHAIDYRYENQDAFMARANSSIEDLERAASVLRSEDDPLTTTMEDNLNTTAVTQKIADSHETLDQKTVDQIYAHWAEHGDLSRLTPTQIDALEHAIQIALVDDDALLTYCYNIKRNLARNPMTH